MEAGLSDYEVSPDAQGPGPLSSVGGRGPERKPLGDFGPGLTLHLQQEAGAATTEL